MNQRYTDEARVRSALSFFNVRPINSLENRAASLTLPLPFPCMTRTSTNRRTSLAPSKTAASLVSGRRHIRKQRRLFCCRHPRARLSSPPPQRPAEHKIKASRRNRLIIFLTSQTSDAPSIGQCHAEPRTVCRLKAGESHLGLSFPLSACMHPLTLSLVPLSSKKWLLLLLYIQRPCLHVIKFFTRRDTGVSSLCRRLRRRQRAGLAGQSGR